jgi:hypothetical protein
MADDRKDQIAAAIEHLVRPDEVWIIRRTGGVLDVQEEGQSPLASTHPEIHGRLLQANESVKSAGAGLIIYGMLIVAAGCLAIHLHWLDSVVGSKVESVRSIWFYGFVLVASFFLLATIMEYFERHAYRRFRTSIITALQAARLNPNQVMSLIHRDKALTNVAEYLKKDEELAG